MPDKPNEPIDEGSILTDADQFTAMALAMNRFREKFVLLLDGATEHDKIAWYLALRSVVTNVEDRDPAFKKVGDTYLDLWNAIKHAHDLDPKDFHDNLPGGAKRHDK